MDSSVFIIYFFAMLMAFYLGMYLFGFILFGLWTSYTWRLTMFSSLSNMVLLFTKTRTWSPFILLLELLRCKFCLFWCSQGKILCYLCYLNFFIFYIFIPMVSTILFSKLLISFQFCPFYLIPTLLSTF